ncbi:CRISPR-associated protein Cas5 [Methanobacterium formicicum]|uniref:CRISPR-associated protein Cas5 n=1 Tax=Methanobacterium formicicum TaxID=2162 RepID=UPI0024908FA1|nr:CRISPR-associated protein Cas5 [Methanobacterium formicicum]
MRVIRFTLEGSMNSFRIPQTSAYQLTYLAPTKTQIVGMLTSIMGKNEKNYYELLKKLNIGIVPKQVDSLFTDDWTFRKWKTAGSGRDILRREKLYKPIYIIYVSAEDILIDDVLNSLKTPQRIPSIGLDDELTLIKDVKEISMEIKESNSVHSVFQFKEGMSFEPKFHGTPNMQIFPPRIVTINLEFDNNVIPRKPKNHVQLVEFVGVYCELNSKKALYIDQEKNCNVDML